MILLVLRQILHRRLFVSFRQSHDPDRGSHSEAGHQPKWQETMDGQLFKKEEKS